MAGKGAGRGGLLETLRYYYESDTPDGHRFRYALLGFDLVTVLFIVATSLLERGAVLESIDILFGLAILADFTARLAISRRRLREFLHPATWADIAAIVSFLAPIIGEGRASCASCARSACCARISCWSGCARTARGSGATRTPSSRSFTSRSSSSS